MERRRDARLAPTGSVRLSAVGNGLSVQGRLVDVSARGMRIRSGAGGAGVGARVRLEIQLEDVQGPKGRPRLLLDGLGAVIWTAGPEPDGTTVRGVLFDAPLRVRGSFPELSVF